MTEELETYTEKQVDEAIKKCDKDICSCGFQEVFRILSWALHQEKRKVEEFQLKFSPKGQQCESQHEFPPACVFVSGRCAFHWMEEWNKELERRSADERS